MTEQIQEINRRAARSHVEALWYDLEHLTRDYVCDRTGFGGLQFKTMSYYLTHEGYGVGTQCWYMTLRWNGLKKTVAADTQDQVLNLAIEWFKGRLEDGQD